MISADITNMEPHSPAFSRPERHPGPSRKYSDEGYYTATPPEESTDDEEPRELGGGANLVAVVGVGYVGLELVLSFSSAYRIIGFDVSEQRVAHLQRLHARKNHIRFTHDAADLASATHFLISVPTLLLPDHSIDSSALQSALKLIRRYARPGATVVVESSVAVGMTRQLLGPLAAEKGLFGGMSPEVSVSVASHNSSSSCIGTPSPRCRSVPHHCPLFKSSRREKIFFIKKGEREEGGRIKTAQERKTGTGDKINKPNHC